MFGRGPVLLLNTLLGPKLRYLGTSLNTLSPEALKNIFEIAVTNLKIAREREAQKISTYIPNYNLYSISSKSYQGTI